MHENYVYYPIQVMPTAIYLQDFVLILILQATSNLLFRILIFQENSKIRSMLFQLIILVKHFCVIRYS